MDGQLRPSVILIREWEQQMSSSGCCSRLEGDFLLQRGEPVFAERRAGMESLGPLYQAVRERFGAEVELQIVDPRNFLTLLVLLLRDFRAHRVGFRDAVRTVTGLPVQGVIVNGRLFARGAWPAPEELLSLLEGAVSSPRGQPV